jgi:hypothetical protein
MPTYNPKDMAYVLQMSKSSGKYTPEEMALMQNINQSVAGGAMTGMPTQTMDPNSVVRPGEMPMRAVDPDSVLRPGEASMAMPQGQPMNRLAQIQAAANQVLGGGQNPEGSRMANIARYFQGRQ